jgi:hypothetical protein
VNVLLRQPHGFEGFFGSSFDRRLAGDGKRGIRISSKEDRMRKLLASLALAAAFALLPAQAASADILNLSGGVFPDDQLAALSSTGDPFAVGGGTLLFPAGEHFAFSAHLGPNGPSGYAVVSSPTLGEAQGHVCAYRPGPAGSRAASFFINVERGSGVLGGFPNLEFLAVDNSPSGASDILGVDPASLCSDITEPTLASTVVQGNIVVKD